MSVVEILFMGKGRHNDAVGFGHRHGSFGSKFVFLVLLAFGYTVDVRLVQGINLVRILRLLGQDPTVKSEVLSLFLPESFRQLARRNKAWTRSVD